MTAKVITVASPKGGVGKTTTCINLAIDLANQGFNVALVDGEFKGTCLNYQARENTDNLDIFAGYNTNISKQIAAYRTMYDFIVCDTSGFNAEAEDNKQATVNQQIISSADLIIVPVTPSPSAVEKTFSFFEYVNAFVNASRGQIKAFSFINQYVKGQRLSTAAVEALAGDALPVPLADVRIRDAAAIAQAEAELKSINEYKKGSLVAGDYRRLLTHVKNTLA